MRQVFFVLSFVLFSQGGASAEPTRSLKATFRYNIYPGFFLSPWYDYYQEGSGMSYALSYEIRRRDLFFRFGMDYTDLNFPDGNWLEKDDPVTSTDFSRIDLSFLSIDAAIYGVREFSRWFYLLFGAGLGVGYVGGQITSQDTMGGAEIEPAGRQPDPNAPVKNEDFPRILPVFESMLIGRFFPNEHAPVDLSFGFRNGISFGLSAGYAF